MNTSKNISQTTTPQKVHNGAERKEAAVFAVLDCGAVVFFLTGVTIFIDKKSKWNLRSPVFQKEPNHNPNPNLFQQIFSMVDLY